LVLAKEKEMTEDMIVATIIVGGLMILFVLLVYFHDSIFGDE
jgi:hypothetical protein